MTSVLTNWRWWMVASTTAALILTVLPLVAEAGETDTFRFQPYPLEVQGQERRTFELNLEAGESITDSVQLTNKSEEARRFRIYPADASVDGAGRVTVAESTAPRQGVGSWIEVDVDDDELALLPKTSEVIRFSVTRPADQSAEGTGAIVAEEIRTDDPGGGIDVAYRVAILVRLTGDPTGLELTDPRLQLPLQIVPSNGQAYVDIANHTTQPVDATVELIVESLTGYQWRLDPVDVSIQPGSAAPVTQEWTTVPRWGGLLRVRAEATWEAGTVASTGSRNVYPALWLLALVIAAVGVRGLWEMWSRRQERKAEVVSPAPDPEALRRRLIEAALWLHAAGRDAPTELRHAVATEARAIASEAGRAPDAQDIQRAARSLETFVRDLGSGGESARRSANDFDTWLRQQRDDPRIEELVGS